MRLLFARKFILENPSLHTVLVEIMVTLMDYFSPEDVSNGRQINTGAKQGGCKLDGSVWLAKSGPSKVCRTRPTWPSVNIILTKAVCASKLSRGGIKERSNVM
jgi:hypothetical protein